MNSPIKTSMTNRLVTKKTIPANQVPYKVNKLLDNLNDLSITKFFYNGGEMLVNYGLNSFVRDIYVNKFNNCAIYSDRFGNYSNIINKAIIEHLDNSSLCVTPEGVLLFYSKNKDCTIYATLNCKFGLLFSLSSTINIESDISGIDIFTSNGKTYMELSQEYVYDKSYYLIDFSFNLYNSYGSQFEIKFYRLDGVVIKEDILNGKIEKPIESIKIAKQNNAKLLVGNSKNVNVKDFKKTYKYYINFSRKETIKSIYSYSFSFNGDTKVNDCINSFTKEIHFYKLSGLITISLFTAASCSKAIIVQYDRYNDCYINDELSYNKFISLCNSKMYVSSEGVMVAINNNYIFISLDGIVWKSYNMKDYFTDECYYGIYDFVVKNSRNYIISYKDNEKKQITKEYLLTFRFNFWDLYESPVEMSIE